MSSQKSFSSEASGSLESPSPDALPPAKAQKLEISADISSKSLLLKEKSSIHEADVETSYCSVTRDTEDKVSVTCDTEGKVFHTCDTEGKVYDEEGRREFTDSEFEQYCAAAIASKGFDVPNIPDDVSPPPGMITPLSKLGDYEHETIRPLCLAAICDFNARNGKMYEFLHLEKANAQADIGLRYYLTFEARDPENSTNQTFQADVLRGIPKQRGGDCVLEVFYCEPKV